MRTSKSLCRLHATRARWAAALGGPRRSGIAGAWNSGRGLVQHLVASGATVSEVSLCWTPHGCCSAREVGKSDAADSRSVAMLVWREGDTVPWMVTEDETAVLDLLVTEQESTLAEATRLRNQIHYLLLQLDPEYRAHLPSMQMQAGLAAPERYTSPKASVFAQEHAAVVWRPVRRLRLARNRDEELAAQIRRRTRRFFSCLTRLSGINLLTASALADILDAGRRFASNALCAAYAGVALLEASSASVVRHRLNRGGNRRLNAILNQIALTQARYSPEEHLPGAPRRRRKNAP